MAEMRKIEGVYKSDDFHWVGDGFRMTPVIPGNHDFGERISPFILLDYHAPYEYEPTDTPPGVGVHPHRGFETVTLAFEGSVAHHDSTGAGGVINPGDVQWMKAASGILHKEYHEQEWAKTGGRFHMMQLWVNLPAKNKMEDPRYQPILASDMGIVEVQNGRVIVIAGQYQGVQGPAEVHSPINLWRVELDENAEMSMSFPADENASIFVMEGTIVANGTTVDEHSFILFENEGEDISIESTSGAHFVVLQGKPLGEPVVAHGPFVMNSEEEIRLAYRDFLGGNFGQLE